MGADTWVSLAQHRLPPNSTTQPKKPEVQKAVAAPTSPRGPQKCEQRKEFGWFWITRKRTQPGPLTFTRPSLDAGNAGVSPRPRVDEGPSLSRVSSGESWLEVTRDCDGSSDDLTDLEDSNLVSVAPRTEPRVRSIRITSSGSSVPSIAGRRLDDSDAAPAGSRLSGSDAPEPTSMQRECDAQDLGEGIRMRTAVTSAGRVDALASCTKEGTTGNNSRDQGEGNRDTEGVLSMARVAAVCGVAPDSDLLWTFLAGMMLYFMSV